MIAGVLGRISRGLQATQPRRPIGISTAVRRFHQWLPQYEGVIRLEDDLKIAVDTRIPYERNVFWVGDAQRGLTYTLRQHTPAGAYCLDVGANIGFYALKLARWAGANGRVASFEPDPNAQKRLRHNLSLNPDLQVTVIPKAVYAQAGKLEFHVAESGLSSVEQIAGAVENITVEATTIDDFMREVGWTRLDVIKIDIEGSDHSALVGARETLRRFRPFLVFEGGAESEHTEAAFALLAELGYTLRALIKRSGAEAPFDRNITRAYDVIAYPQI